VTDVVLAIDFGGTKTAVGCVSASGELLVSRRLPTAPTADVVHRAVKEATQLRQQTPPGWQLIGAGVVSPGVVLEDRILLAPNMPGWESLSLSGELHAGFAGLPVTTGNDVQAAALAEARWGNLAGRDGLYVNLGTGLGSAIVLDGRVIRGHHGAAGEIGYARGKDGRTLEEVIGGGGLGARASQIAGRAMSAAEAFASADPRVRRGVDEAIAEFARELANLATLLDPERVVIGGGLANDGDRLLGPLRETFEKIVPFPAEIVASAFARDASLFGAAALAITQALEVSECLEL
jgi:glucokinase